MALNNWSKDFFGYSQKNDNADLHFTFFSPEKLAWLFSLKKPSLDKIEKTFNLLIMKFFPPLRRSCTNP